jgi:hypothetical protein
VDTAAALAQIDDVMADYGRVQREGGLGSGAEAQAIGTRLKAAILRLSPPGGDYARKASECDKGSPGYNAEQLFGILLALRADLDAGYVQSLAELLHADVFADFLEMADELQRAGFKDAAAVIAGSVLEEHLRKLAAKAGLAVEKADGSPMKADTLNSELTAAEVYNKLQQKSVTAWLGLRNGAAHGEYRDYDHEQVAAFIRDVREFLILLPA